MENVAKIDKNQKLKTENATLWIFNQNEVGLEKTMPLSHAMVHFFYCKSGDVVFKFSEQYQRQLPQGSFFTIYDSQRSLHTELISEKCQLVYMAMSPEFIHQMLLDDNKNMVKLGFEGFGVREYSVKTIGFGCDILLDQLLNGNEPNVLKSAFYQAKVLELLSYTFDVEETSLYEACPFLKEKDNVERIKNARNILIEQYEFPPGLAELAKLIGMNEYNLKIGFKNVYGLPPYKYLQEYKLNMAKKMLNEGQMQVAEIADSIGYKSASHFIEAFRKKFGITPKKFGR
ncbi:MAG: helix-turn-helix transcriptional regulator [Flavobacteriales bacterium]|nr:helix-turn-helix transcriptional regulator [Flavobacteriales bacterium]